MLTRLLSMFRTAQIDYFKATNNLVSPYRNVIFHADSFQHHFSKTHHCEIYKIYCGLVLENYELELLSYQKNKNLIIKTFEESLGLIQKKPENDNNKADNDIISFKLKDNSQFKIELLFYKDNIPTLNKIISVDSIRIDFLTLNENN